MKKNITKSSLALLLAGTVALPNAQVFAEEPEGQAVSSEAAATQTEVLKQAEAAIDTEAGTVSSGTQSPTEEKQEAAEEGKTEEASTADGEETSTQEGPSLLPGDFFYFIKIAMEKIQLAFTSDDKKEAELLAVYTAERISEAEKLLKDGEEEKAVETIQNAISYLKGLETKVDEPQASTEEEKAEDEASDAAENTENVGTVDEESDKAQDSEKAEDSNSDLQIKVSQNIIALTAAMEKVKNPVAKAALAKNIEKSYKKLARKLARLEEVTGKQMDIEEEIAKILGEQDALVSKAETEAEETAAEATEAEKTEASKPEDTQKSEEEVKASDETAMEDSDDVKAEAEEEASKLAKAAKQQAKLQEKAAHEEAKKQAAAEREKAKAAREEARKQAAAAREQAKKQAKEAREQEKAARNEAKQQAKASKEEAKQAHKAAEAKEGEQKGHGKGNH